jgi:hypothetical protein
MPLVAAFRPDARLRVAIITGSTQLRAWGIALRALRRAPATLQIAGA